MYKNKNYERAKNALLSLHHNENKNIEIIKVLINIYANQGKYDEAFEYCMKGIEINKADSDFHYMLSNIYSEKKDMENSLNELRKVLYLDENHLLANYNLASVFITRQDFKTALKYLYICQSILNSYQSKDIIPFADDINPEQMKTIIKNQIQKIKEDE